MPSWWLLVMVALLAGFVMIPPVVAFASAHRHHTRSNVNSLAQAAIGDTVEIVKRCMSCRFRGPAIETRSAYEYPLPIVTDVYTCELFGRCSLREVCVQGSKKELDPAVRSCLECEERIPYEAENAACQRY